jgi:MYXO-CTERM domain-containing protein
VSITTGFAIASGTTTAFQVQPGGSQPYTLVCHPAATGTMAGTFTVASNDPATPMVNVPLTCNGIASNLDIQPSPATLPTTRVGEPVDLAIDLKNTGSASMTIESVAVTGTGLTMTSGPASGTVLGAGASTTVGVHFDAAMPGDVAGMLVTTYDGGQTRTTPIAARALATSMSLSPDGTVDFGPVCVGQTKAQPFVVMANQPGAFQVIAIDDPPAPFSVAKPALPAHVAGSGGDRVMFTVTASPAAAGPATGSLAIATDIPGATPHAIDLATLGLPAGVSATPDTVDLGSHAVDTTSIAQTVTLTNCTEGAITATAQITGADASEFAIVQAPDAAISQAGNATWLVVLQAHSVGLKTAVLAIDDGSQMLTVPLDGEGLGSDGGDKSYYSCSTGGPTAWWPIAFALLGLRRRRLPVDVQ